MYRDSQWYRQNAMLFEPIFAWMRLMFLIGSVLVFAILGIRFLEGKDLFQTALEMQSKIEILTVFPTWLLSILLIFSDWSYIRYFFAPLASIALALIGGGFYIRDIYAISYLSKAFRYLIASMFGILYPRIEIDGGKIKSQAGEEENSLEKIGGPGFVLIQPGNAVIFRDLREPSNIALPQLYFMRPFEKIGTIADIDEQHGYEKEIRAVTHDGIQLHIRDINYRYKILPDVKDGKQTTRSKENPYPFSQTAMLDMAYNRSISEKGEDTWQQGIQRTVNSSITNFIGKNNIDYLTAPRKSGEDPRRTLRVELFAASVNAQMKRLGAELLWIDAGHFDIVEFDDKKEDNVDNQRFAYWATRWIGNDNMVRAIGEAQRVALQEKGRAEAQAELLKNITESLRGFDLRGNPAANIRKLLLVRTAQILEGMREVKTWGRGGK